jgi:hypothetical protein
MIVGGAVAAALLILVNQWQTRYGSGGGTVRAHMEWRAVPLVDRGGLFQQATSRAARSPLDVNVRGKASGLIRYTPAGPNLSLRLRAKGLVPARRYLLEIGADGLIYTLASVAADATGRMAIDTMLTHFAERVCVGPTYDRPRPLRGRHAIRFWIKADGNPRSGSSQDHFPASAEARDLPCSGNGDGDYTYVLFQDQPASFEGRAPETNRQRFSGREESSAGATFGG